MPSRRPPVVPAPRRFRQGRKQRPARLQRLRQRRAQQQQHRDDAVRHLETRAEKLHRLEQQDEQRGRHQRRERIAGRRSENEAMNSAHIRKARTAEGLVPVMSTYSQSADRPAAAAARRGTRSRESRICTLRAMAVMFRPLMAKRCMVPLCMKSACCSSLMSCFCPIIMAGRTAERAGWSERPAPRMHKTAAPPPAESLVTRGRSHFAQDRPRGT